MNSPNSHNSHGLPGKAESYWVDSTPDTAYPQLQDGITVDVAIIEGLVGIMSAFSQVQAWKVAVLKETAL
jgi:hypothetical protein